MAEREAPLSVEIYRAEHTTWNVQRIVNCFTDDAILIRTSRLPVIGKEGIGQLVSEWAAANRKNEVMKHLRVLVDGGRVAAEWEITGSERDGREIHMTGVNIYELESGKIKYLHIHRDL